MWGWAKPTHAKYKYAVRVLDCYIKNISHPLLVWSTITAGKFDQSTGLRGKSATFVHWEVRSTLSTGSLVHVLEYSEYVRTRVREYSGVLCTCFASLLAKISGAYGTACTRVLVQPSRPLFTVQAAAAAALAACSRQQQQQQLQGVI